MAQTQTWPAPLINPMQAFTYLAALQMMWTRGLSSAIAAAGGIAAGVLYRLDFLGLRTKFRVRWKPASR